MSTPVVSSTAGAKADHRSRRPRLVLAALAACLMVLAGGAVWLTPTSEPGPAIARPITLTLPGTDPLTSICAPFDPASLAAQEVAFAGTVTSIDGAQVRLAVSRWYRGGEGAAWQVTITVPAGFTAALDGVDFTTGEKYLVSATGGVVGSCGSSGVATPELTAIFERAFG